MSTINVSNLILTLQQKIDSSTNEKDLLNYSKAMQQLRTGHVFAVETVSNLPNATQNLGFLYYVKSDESVYFATSQGWVALGLYPNPMILFSWGVNSGRQLGDGTITDRCSPVREFCSATDWCQVCFGYNHATAIKTSGQLWSWGCGGNGVFGNGTAASFTASPVREFCSATDWCQVSGGNIATAAIKTSGQLWAWGVNCGQLGDGTTVPKCSPVREICSATNWCQVSATTTRTAAIKTSGELWAWGYNSSGRLGDGTTVSTCSPVREFCSATDWCQVSSGGGMMAAVKTSGQLWVWGYNNCGRLGDGTVGGGRCSPVREICSATDWSKVSVSFLRHTTAVKTSGQLWAWGSNNCGQLGDGTVTQRCSPVREICSATDWCQVSAGGFQTYAIKTSSQLWAWGSNNCGRLGDGTTVTRCSPVREFCSATDWCQVSSGNSSTMAIRSIPA